MLVGISVAVAAVTILILGSKAQIRINERGGCPECGMPVPRFRRPTSFRQALWGGWTCEKCGTELDREGREMTKA